MLRTRGLLSLAAIVFCIAMLGGLSSARAAGCDAYDTVFEFKFNKKNFEGNYTTGCVGFDKASIAAGSGPAYYEDTYCGGRSMTTTFRVIGSRVRLSEFVYPGCNGKGTKNVADITLTGLTSTADSACFSGLEFYWKYSNGGGDTSKASATGNSLCAS